MPLVAVNEIELFYETEGDPDGPPLLLIAGLGVQLIGWPDHFIDPLVKAGFHVIRFDNRDIGLSTSFEGAMHEPHVVLERMLTGEDPGIAYTLNDMASDATGLLDVLEIEAAHVVGVSMGAMIAQLVAIESPERVLSLTSIMSTTGAADVGQPSAEALEILLASAPGTDRDVLIPHRVQSVQAWASPGHFDESATHRVISASWDRAGDGQIHNPGRQFCAIVATSSRDEALRAVTVPSLVVHGSADVLIDPTGGERTAECLPNASFMMAEGMGHDLPPALTPAIVNAIVDLAIT